MYDKERRKSKSLERIMPDILARNQRLQARNLQFIRIMRDHGIGVPPEDDL